MRVLSDSQSQCDFAYQADGVKAPGMLPKNVLAGLHLFIWNLC